MPTPMPMSQWLMLGLLAVLWGFSFFFIGVILRELPPLTTVLCRIALGAAILLVVVRAMGLRLPATFDGWIPFAVMSVFNNVIPFALIARGQLEVGSGLASILNATTPVWSVLFAHAYIAGERMTLQRCAGVLLGIAGVAVLSGPDVLSGHAMTLAGMVLVLAGAASYAVAGVWGQRQFKNTSPIMSSCCQLVCSTLIVLPVALAVDQPWTLPIPSAATLLAIGGLGALSTALAYVVFYRILAVSGGTNVMLVTLLIPIVTVLLGTTFLGESFLTRTALGGLIIAAALLTIDGRLPRAVAAGFSRR